MKKEFLLLLLIFVCILRSYSQRLPKSQMAGKELINNIKIDGKDNEGMVYSAYNTNTNIFYTLANNDTNLYLMIKAESPEIIKKIISGAITLTISKTNELKKTNSAVSVTYPVYDRKDGPAYINLKNHSIKNGKVNPAQADSFMNAVNKQLMAKTKLIGITGIKEISDSTLSIYNEDGIKALARFNEKIQYIYELLIPLKYLGLSVDEHSTFSYNIRLNGMVTNGMKAELSPSGRFIQVSGGAGGAYVLPVTPENIMLSSSTDFSAKYTLVR